MPFYQNRAASNPTLAAASVENRSLDQPFNYIAFSQQLYGDKKDKNPSVLTLDNMPKQRTISYV